MDGIDPMSVEFSSPILSSDAHLAVVEVSFFGSGRWGYGSFCVLIKVGADWVASCLPSWIA
jgi:hypothetical protein